MEILKFPRHLRLILCMLLCSQRELGCRVIQNFRCVCERDLVTVGVGAIDIVKANCDLRDHFQRAFTRFKHFCIDGVAQCGDQSVDAAGNFFYG